MTFQNKFGSFQAMVDDTADAPVPVAKKAAEKVAGHGREKKVVVKAKVAHTQDQSKVEEGGFTTDAVQGAGKPRNPRPAGERRGGDRGGRGGDRPRTARGGRGRGGEGNQDDRPQTEGRGGRGGRGGNRGGADRGGRGRGDRPRFDRTTEVVEGGDNQGPETHNRGERVAHGYQGKAREEYHPMDRTSGTGRGKKDMRKGGNRAGATGEDKNDNTPVVEGEEGKKEEKAAVEGEEEKKDEPETPVEEVVVEEEEEDLEALPGNYFADYELMKSQQQKTGVLAVKKAREHVEGPKDRVIVVDEKKDMIVEGKTNFSGAEMFAPHRGTGAELLGFSAPAEEEEFQSRDSDRRGGRGGRGRGDRPTNSRGGAGRGADRGARQAPPRQPAGRKNGRIVSNEDDFPTL